MRHLIPALIAAALMAVLIVLDIARPLGAHPWWSQKTLLIGTPIGIILATLATPLSTAAKRMIVFALLTVAALFTAKYGQTQFAASYAEVARGIDPLPWTSVQAPSSTPTWSLRPARSVSVRMYSPREASSLVGSMPRTRSF